METKLPQEYVVTDSIPPLVYLLQRADEAGGSDMRLACWYNRYWYSWEVADWNNSWFQGKIQLLKFQGCKTPVVLVDWDRYDGGSGGGTYERHLMAWNLTGTTCYFDLVRHTTFTEKALNPDPYYTEQGNIDSLVIRDDGILRLQTLQYSHIYFQVDGKDSTNNTQEVIPVNMIYSFAKRKWLPLQ